MATFIFSNTIHRSMALGPLLLMCLLATATSQCSYWSCQPTPTGDKCARIGTHGFQLVLTCGVKCSSNTSDHTRRTVEWSSKAWNATYRYDTIQSSGLGAVNFDAREPLVEANGSLVIPPEQVRSSTLDGVEVKCVVLLENNVASCGQENFTLQVLRELVFTRASCLSILVLLLLLLPFPSSHYSSILRRWYVHCYLLL